MLKGKDLVLAWERAKDEGVSRKKFAKSLGRTVGAIRSEIYREKKKRKKGVPKVLIFDIETSKITVELFQTGQQYVRPDQVTEDWYIISWAGKWLGNSKIYSDIVTPNEAIKRNDRRICSSLWELFDEADIIVAHNLKGFDRKKANWRFLIHNFSPPMPYKMVDTLTESRKVFNPTSHSLDFLLKSLGLRHKLENEKGLWDRCMKGDQKSLDKMLKYNIRDVIALEPLYKTILPWIENHPNVNLYQEDVEQRCRNCGGEVELSDTVITTATSAYKTYRCKECYHPGRMSIPETTTEQRKKLLR